MRSGRTKKPKHPELLQGECKHRRSSPLLHFTIIKTHIAELAILEKGKGKCSGSNRGVFVWEAFVCFHNYFSNRLSLTLYTLAEFSNTLPGISQRLKLITVLLSVCRVHAVCAECVQRVCESILKWFTKYYSIVIYCVFLIKFCLIHSSFTFILFMCLKLMCFVVHCCNILKKCFFMP